MSRDPYMLQQFAKFAAAESAENGFDDVEVHVFALCSLNGRKPDLFIDPAIDLTAGPNGTVYEHVLEFTKQLPEKPWDEPVDRWETLVMPDPIQSFLHRKLTFPLRILNTDREESICFKTTKTRPQKSERKQDATIQIGIYVSHYFIGNSGIQFNLSTNGVL